VPEQANVLGPVRVCDIMSGDPGIV
jgi:hypothetical protein